MTSLSIFIPTIVTINNRITLLADPLKFTSFNRRFSFSSKSNSLSLSPSTHQNLAIMEHECEQQHFTPLVFTSHTGKVFQMEIDDFAQLSPKHGRSNSVVSIIELRASSPSPEISVLGGFDGHDSETPQPPKYVLSPKVHLEIWK